MANGVNVQIIVDFPEDKKGGYPAFYDAVYVPLDDYKKMSVSQVEAVRQERYDGWKAQLDEGRNQPAPEPVVQGSTQTTVDEVRQTLQDALARLDALPTDDIRIDAADGSVEKIQPEE